ncbi:hypothetical protein BCR43DRAFT_559717 [Syncephalastrum racemosum]|uniref:Uncharacterized protein n=1 Tax=Syncephalastrum racemosum TaxID=13706 RepID=A0A1X2HTG2_SYNRA|nr:hypothetical protein BCR43DRAFT_559717 [Syncephalastrum racemosum]
MTSLTLPSSTASPSRVFVSPIPTQSSPGEREKTTEKRYQPHGPETYLPPSPPLSQQEGHLGRYHKKLPPLQPLTHTTSMKHKGKEEPLSPPLSPLFSRRRRLPRWLKQMSAPAEPTSSRRNQPIPKEPASPNLLKTTLYYGSPQVRTYLHDVLATDRMEEVIMEGFPIVCGNTLKDASTTPRVRTLRLTLTPAHCRATETEIYGDDNDRNNACTNPTTCPQSLGLLPDITSPLSPPQNVISPPQRVDSLPCSKNSESSSSPSSLHGLPKVAEQKVSAVQHPTRQRQPALFVITPSQPDCLQRYENWYNAPYPVMK